MKCEAGSTWIIPIIKSMDMDEVKNHASRLCNMLNLTCSHECIVVSKESSGVLYYGKTLQLLVNRCL